MSLGYRIQQLRKQRKMSQEELGERLEVTRQTVSKWELEQSTPDLDYISAISDLFEVTTDYLIKGEKISEPTADNTVESSVAVLRENENTVAAMRYCNSSEEYGQPVMSFNTASAVSEKYVVTLKINFKSVLKTILALAAMFLGFLDCFIVASMLSQPNVKFGAVFGFCFLFLAGVFVFVVGLSAFAEPLMRFSKLMIRFSKSLDMLFLHICGFLKDFNRAFKAVKAERMSCLGKCTSEKNEEMSADGKNSVIFFKRAIGLILTIAGGYMSVLSIFLLSHFWDGGNRNYFLLIMEIVLILVFVVGTFAGLKMLLFPYKMSKISKNYVEEKDGGVDAVEKSTDKITSAVQKREERALRIKEHAEIKANLVMERNRAKAEKIAPINEAKAEKVLENSKLIEARILENAEKKAAKVLNGHFNRGGAHIK